MLSAPRQELSLLTNVVAIKFFVQPQFCCLFLLFFYHLKIDYNSDHKVWNSMPADHLKCKWWSIVFCQGFSSHVKPELVKISPCGSSVLISPQFNGKNQVNL